MSVLTLFINYGGVDEHASVEQSFDLLVVPALQAKNLLVGRDWGRLVQCEVLLKNDSDVTSNALTSILITNTCTTASLSSSLHFACFEHLFSSFFFIQLSVVHPHA